jgi:regulator of sigma E protease
MCAGRLCIMGEILPVVAVVLVFALVILIHEAGHMLFAKLAGVDVTDFAIGFGPSLISREWRGTRYHICAFPLGGFVNIAGLDPDDPITERSFRTTKTWWKLCILAGGSLGNILLGIVLIFVLSFIGFPRSVVIVEGVVVGSPAAEAGLLPGDVVEQADGKRIYDSLSLSNMIRDAAARQEPIELIIDRRGGKFSRILTPRVFTARQDGKDVIYNEGKPSLGITNMQAVMVTRQADLVLPNSKAADAGIRPGDMVLSVGGQNVEFGSDIYYLVDPDGKGLQKPTPMTVERAGKRFEIMLPAGTNLNNFGVLFHSELERLPFKETIVRAVRTVYITTILFVSQMKLLASKEGAEMISGPLGIVSLIAQSSRTGLYNLIQIAMIITLNLGIMNLLPIPALDGGHIFFVFLRSLGLRINSRREATMHKVGFMVLITFILLITFRDALGLWKMR